MKRVHRFPFQRLTLTGITWRKVKHHRVSDVRLARHEPGLSCREMIPVASLFCITIQIRRFAIEDIGAMGECDDFGFVVLVVSRIDDVGNLLSSRDRQETVPSPRPAQIHGLLADARRTGLL